jgi:hypothetical protein
MKSLGSSYNADLWELTVYLDGKEYTYTNVSPHHNDKFVAKAKKNRGRAMAYVRTFPRKESDGS